MSSGQLIDQCVLGADFVNGVLQNRFNGEILGRFGSLGFSDWWLTAGCLAQTIWNLNAGRQSEADINDYDIFYFDPDTDWKAEDRVISQAAALFADLPVRIEVRNQARVPIWYPEKFGFDYGPVHYASDGIDRFAYQTTAIGLRKDRNGSFRIYAPFGLEAAMSGQIIPNPVLPIRKVYEAKVARWKKIWPDLVIGPWPDDVKAFP